MLWKPKLTLEATFFEIWSKSAKRCGDHSTTIDAMFRIDKDEKRIISMQGRKEIDEEGDDAVTPKMIIDSACFQGLPSS
jgi:hypothetical protein